MKIYKIANNKYFYHGSFDDNLYGIWTNGLQPSTNPHWSRELGETSVGKVFFCSTPEETETYTSLIKDYNYDATDFPEVFIFRVAALNLPDIAKPSENIDEFYVERAVDPKYIEIFWGNEWKNLLNLSENMVRDISQGSLRENSIEFLDEEN